MDEEIGEPSEYETVLRRCRDEVERACETLVIATKRELLRRAQTISPSEFERLVVRLFVTMGYGCRGEVTGRSGDFGIDGVIYVDRIGLDEIFVQAKRWTNSPVGRPDVQKFCGSLAGRNATKGIMITTSYFTEEARTYAMSLPTKIVLIDGSQLAELLYDCDLWVSSSAVFEVKHLESVQPLNPPSR